MGVVDGPGHFENGAEGGHGLHGALLFEEFEEATTGQVFHGVVEQARCLSIAEYANDVGVIEAFENVDFEEKSFLYFFAGVGIEVEYFE